MTTQIIFTRLFILAVAILLSACVPSATSTPTIQTPSAVPATTPKPSLLAAGNFASLKPQEAIETYFQLLTAHQFTDAYQLLSPSSTHYQPLAEFVARSQELYDQYELLHIESLPVWSATLQAGTPTAKIIVENERCKRFGMEVKQTYRAGLKVAEPAEIDSLQVTVVREVGGWKIIQIDSLAPPDVCDRYASYRLRITNTSAYDLKNLEVIFPKERISIGDLPAGATSKYKDVPNGVYTFAAYQFTLNEKEVGQTVVDWIGETELPGSFFTYRIDVDPNQLADNQTIQLIEVTTDDYLGR